MAKMSLADSRWRWRTLHDALVALSSDAETQIASVGTAHPDELALDFDDGYGLVPTLESDGVVFSRNALSALAQVNDALAAMSGPAMSELWTVEAIRTRPEWSNVRRLAQQALAVLPASP